MKLLARRVLALLAFSPLLAMAAGCANQKEGERCDLKNGDADCEPGLVCTSKIVSRDAFYVCCPASGGAKAPACNASNAGQGDAGTDVGTRADTGADDGTSDSTNDPATEPTDDSSTVDTGADISSDVSADMSTRDTSPEGSTGDARDALNDSTSSDRAPDGANDTTSVDAPSDDVVDAPPDVAGEASVDAPDDNATPDDAVDSSDAASLDGSG